jgi:hypothetical protein
MAERKAPQNAAEILKALHEFILGPEEDVSAMSREQVQAALKADGIDPAPLTRRVRDRLAKMRAAEELGRAHIQRQQLLELRARMPSLPAVVREHILTRLKSLSVQQPAFAHTYFRKFEEASEADIHSLLEDLILLDKMDEHDADSAKS